MIMPNFAKNMGELTHIPPQPIIFTILKNCKYRLMSYDNNHCISLLHTNLQVLKRNYVNPYLVLLSAINLHQ